MILFDSVAGLFDDANGLFDDAGVLNSTISLSGLTLTASNGTVTANGQSNATATVSGTTSSITTGEVIALGTGSSITTVSGSTANIRAGTVTAISDTVTTKKGRRTNAKFLPFTPIPVQVSINGQASINFAVAIAQVGQVTATASVSNRAKVIGANSRAVCRIQAVDAIMNPTDDEIIWLLAA